MRRSLPFFLPAVMMSFSAPPAEAKPQVLILGTYHMHNPKQDVVKSELRGA
jgi:hypothetical protein